MNDKTDNTREIALPLPAEPGTTGQPILRLRGDDEGPKEVAVGVVMPLEHGKAIPPGADIIEMRGRKGSPVMEVKTIYESPDKPKRSGGWKPMSVSRETFDRNWDRIFGKKDYELVN